MGSGRREYSGGISGRKAKAEHKLTTEERLALFDANMKWLDELQAEELKEAKAKGTRITVGTAAGPAKNSTTTTVDCLVATLVDTNVLVYLCDPRDPHKRATSRTVLRDGEASGDLRIPHQALGEFVSSVTKSRGAGGPLMTLESATRQAELFMAEFHVLYPDEHIFRTALRGMATYKLSWYYAHLWAYAEHYGLPEILTEDFDHGRMYGTVTIRNPFIELGPEEIR
jgi:predicted nucleic acid-binding protein